jgi:hypothetical protein
MVVIEVPQLLSDLSRAPSLCPFPSCQSWSAERPGAVKAGAPLCAAERSLDGEDRSAKFRERERGQARYYGVPQAQNRLASDDISRLSRTGSVPEVCPRGHLHWAIG